MTDRTYRVTEIVGTSPDSIQTAIGNGVRRAAQTLRHLDWFEVTGAVNNFRFNESPVGLLGRLAEVGATEPSLPREWSDYFTRAAMPPALFEDFNMSSVSQAS